MDEVQANAHTYAEQAFKILDRDKAQIRYNAEWLASLNFADLIRMASNFTIQQFLTRDNFRKRLEAGAAIYLHETFYSLMQAYDAVALKTDVQVGGADQLFNIVVAGRKLQEAMGQPPMIAIIMGESLPGTDGVIKMSKSLGNHIPLMTTPEDMYGKIMSVPDAAMRIYHKLLLGWGEAQLQQLDQEMESKPREVKMALARELVSTFHDQQSSTQAEEHFIRVFTEKAVPDDIPIVAVAEAVRLLDLLSAQQLVASKGEARRLIEQGGIRINGEQVVDLETLIDPTDGKEIIIKVGKRKFLKVTG
jgi:tyrosyl-tRNA synthetase